MDQVALALLESLLVLRQSSKFPTSASVRMVSTLWRSLLPHLTTKVTSIFGGLNVTL